VKGISVSSKTDQTERKPYKLLYRRPELVVLGAEDHTLGGVGGGKVPNTGEFTVGGLSGGVS